MTDQTDSAPNSSSAEVNSSGGRRRSEETRGCILDHARVAFNQRPYSEVSLKEIAAEAGVSAPLIIKYFGTKENLYEAQLDFSAVAERIAGMDFDCLGTALLRVVIEAPEDSPNSLIRKLADAGGNRRIVSTLGQVFRSQVVSPVLQRVYAEADELTRAGHGDDVSDAEMRAEAAISMLIGVAMMRRLITQDYFKQADVDAFVSYYGGLVQKVLDGEA